MVSVLSPLLALVAMPKSMMRAVSPAQIARFAFPQREARFQSATGSASMSDRPKENVR